jgi:hypothetical protein
MRGLVSNRPGVPEPVLNTSTSLNTDALTETWQRVLRLPSIGPNDNFFEFGSDSALALQLFAEIADVFGAATPITSLQLPRR